MSCLQNTLSSLTLGTNEQEEDFNSQLYHRELLPKVSAAEVYFLLDESVSFNATAEIPPDMRKAIETRLLFRRSILKALEENTGPLKRRTKSSLLCIPLLQDIRDTSHLGIPVNESFSTKIQRSLASSVPPRPMVRINFSDALSHFETLCNDAADIDQILTTQTSEDLSTAIWVFMSRVPRPSVYMRAVVQSFLLDRETLQVRVLGKLTPKQFLVSSLAAIILPNSPMINPANDFIEAPTNPRFQIARLFTEFYDKVGHQYLNVFRNACLNRCRTRRTLCHLVLDWDTLQADAEDLDGTMRTYTEEQPALYASDQPTFSYPLSSWTYYHKLNHLRLIIQMGFELTIYAPDEMAGMYWYLSYTCGTHLSHIDRITFFLQRDMETQDSLPPGSTVSSQSEVEDRVASQRTLRNLFRTYTHLKATDAFSRALHALHTLLIRHEVIKTPARPYSTDKLRYELRMRPFLGLNVPEPVTFETFQEESSIAGLSDEQVLEEAETMIAEARKFWDEVLKQGWSTGLADNAEKDRLQKLVKTGTRKGATTIEGEWSKAVKNVIRACIATSISIAALKKRFDKTGELRGIKATIPVPGEKDCWHEWWIVPKLSI
jgi:N-alpha-acetyltransferase 35, NatC auxiliary subunit